MATPSLNEPELLIQAENTPQPQFEQFLNHLDEQYHSGPRPLVSDATYDKLNSLYVRKFGPRATVGALPRGERVELPQYLPSLDKIKTEKEWKAWRKKNPGPILLQDKIDGLTLFYTQKDGVRKLYTRGDGTVGSDVSHIIPYLKLPVLQGDFGIRGEIALSKTNFKPYSGEYLNSRNIIAGNVNARKSFKPEMAAKFDFVAYRIMNSGVTPSQQIAYLKQWGFMVPWHNLVNDISFDELGELYVGRQTDGEYDVDGLVIYTDTVFPETQPPDKYPKKNIVAFKMDGETAIVTVRDIIWQASRWRVLTPVAIYDPVFLSGAELTNATGHNARVIVNGSIARNAEIQIIRSGETIPKILRTIKPGTEWILPRPEQGAYAWDANQVRFILLEDNDEVRADRLKFFIKSLKIKNFGPSRASALVKAGINSIDLLLQVTPEQLAHIDGIGPKLSQDLVANLKTALTSVPLHILMNAVSIFPNVGKRRFETIVKMYPNLLEMASLPQQTLITELQKVPGINEIAKVIAEHLPAFVAWFRAHPQITVSGQASGSQPVQLGSIPSGLISPGLVIPSSVLSGKTSPGNVSNVGTASLLQFDTSTSQIPQTMVGVNVVFTQYRNTALERKIEERGGKVTSAVSGKTTVVVAANPNNETGSVSKALKLGKPVVTEEQFLRDYMK